MIESAPKSRNNNASLTTNRYLPLPRAVARAASQNTIQGRWVSAPGCLLPFDPTLATFGDNWRDLKRPRNPWWLSRESRLWYPHLPAVESDGESGQNIASRFYFHIISLRTKHPDRIFHIGEDLTKSSYQKICQRQTLYDIMLNTQIFYVHFLYMHSYFTGAKHCIVFFL